MSNFTIAKILNLNPICKLSQNCPPPSVPPQKMPSLPPNPTLDNTKDVNASNFYPKDLLSGNCPVIYGDYNDNVKSSIDETPEVESKLQIDESESSMIDQNQNKKKRGRKKGSKNRPKEIIEAEKQIKRRKSDSEGPKMMLARKKSIDPAEAMSEAPNLPTNGETTENEFLCGWCKKLFASPVGRMRHSMHCNWNPDRISKLKAKRKKSKEENEAPRGRSTKMKLSMSHSFPKSSHLHEKNLLNPQSYRSIPLFENGIQFGKKLIPNNRLDYHGGAAIFNEKTNNIKIEVKTECPDSDPDEGAQNDDIPLSSILKKNKKSDFSCPILEPNVKLEV